MDSLYQTESFLTSSIFLWCMSQTSRDQADSRHVRTHKNNSEDSVRLLGTIIQSIFCVQSGASIRLTGLKLSGESRYPGAFPKKQKKTFVAPFFQARLTAPGSQSRDGFEHHHQSLFRYDVCLLSLKSFCWVNDYINGDLSPPKQSRNALWEPYPVLRNFKVANRKIKIIKLIYMFAVWEYEGDIRQLITFLSVVKDLLSLALRGRLFHKWAPLWQRPLRLRNSVRSLGRCSLLAMSLRSYSLVKGLNKSC